MREPRRPDGDLLTYSPASAAHRAAQRATFAAARAQRRAERVNLLVVASVVSCSLDTVDGSARSKPRVVFLGRSLRELTTSHVLDRALRGDYRLRPCG